MTKTLTLVLSMAMALSALPGIAMPAAQQPQTGGVDVVARNAQQQPLPSHTVQLRNIETGQLAGTGLTNATGQFTFSTIAPGNYVVELVNAAGQIVGTATLTVAPGAVANITVAATSLGAIGTTGGGFGIFGLGTAASIGVIGAAAAITVTAIVVAKDDASPSR